MHIDITAEVLQSQLGYSNNDNILEQIEERIKNTKDFNQFSKHIISLNDKLKHINGYIAISNSEKFFKIKCDEIINKDIIKQFDEEVKHWADKYNISLEKLKNKNVYYILGKV